MANLTLRTVKGTPLNYSELDTNFININNELASISGEISTVNQSITTIDTQLTDTMSNLTDVNAILDTKQDTLISGTNIKTVNGASVVGSGNIDLGGAINGILKSNGLGAYSAAISGTDVKTINGNSILGAGDIVLTKSSIGLGNVENTALSTWAGSSNITTIGKVSSLKETKVDLTTNNIDMSSGNLFTKTISGATTFTISNAPTAGTVFAFILDLTNGGSAVITWWSGIKWVAGAAPTLTSAGRDILGFITHDGGTTWVGLLVGKDVK